MNEAERDPVSETTLRQQRAATPDMSVWVSANAGSGKTHVLSRRVIRLLLGGARPSAILCLTYTKAAAAEMSNRIFRALSDWTRLDETALADAISTLEGRDPKPAELSRARALFATALETPGGLKIQTIHAFCESLLHRFPLEANVAGHFQVLDDASAAQVLAEARSDLLSGAGQTPSVALAPVSALASALTTVLDHVGEHGLDQLLKGLYIRRREVLAFLAPHGRQVDWEVALRPALGIPATLTRDEAAARLWPLPSLPEDILRQLRDVAHARSKSTAFKFADDLLQVETLTPGQARIDHVREVFLTGKQELRTQANVAAKDIVQAIPDIGDRLEAAKSQVLAAFEEMKALVALEAASAALVIGRQYLARFEALKLARGFLDYDDLITGAERLLTRESAGAWVHYKLDQGIDHILVDEAQDTGPLQWNVIGSLASEFFSGEGARPALRTLFAVGDEKQSIYSFQGARPERFAEERALVERKAREAGRDFEKISLRVSFRSTREVLDLVDLVFADEDARRGLGSPDEPIIHEAARRSAPGLVELWDPIAAETGDEPESWTAPFDATPESAPPARLARRVTEVLKAWIGREMIMDARSGHMRPVRPGDILVLVRKRDGFVPSLLRTLKATSTIPVAGADRLRLTDHVAVQDLVALGRLSLLSDDDLSLAVLVKSPLVGLGEDHLFRLAGQRPASTGLWDHLARLAETDADFAPMAQRLRRWVGLARVLPPHDFYATVLGPDGGRAQFLARLGREAGDVLDEFLGAALDHEQAGIPGLEAFLATLQSQSPEIKREMEQGADAVRVMTVHAAKGLEAPVVFLVDPGGEAFRSSHLPRIRLLPAVAGSPGRLIVPVWVPSRDCEVEAGAPVLAQLKDEAEEEYRRLLYVGLTRAADRLVVCGYRGKTEARSPTWHSMVAAAVARACDGETGWQSTEIAYGSGENAFTAHRLTRPPRPSGLQATAEAAPFSERAGRPAPLAVEPDVAILQTRLAPERGLPRPLLPSGVNAIIDDEDEAGSGPASPFALSDPYTSIALGRGRAMHRLFQVLPGIEPAERASSALRYIARMLPGLTVDERHSLARSVVEIIDDPGFGAVFSGRAGAEVSIMGTLRLRGEVRIVSGRIDRVAVTGDQLLVVDYKSGRPPAGGAVPSRHLKQLAIYRALLQPLYPDHSIRAALVYPDGPVLIELDADRLEEVFAGLDAD